MMFELPIVHISLICDSGKSITFFLSGLDLEAWLLASTMASGGYAPNQDP